jgi:hypothetical protein
LLEGLAFEAFAASLRKSCTIKPPQQRRTSDLQNEPNLPMQDAHETASKWLILRSCARGTRQADGCGMNATLLLKRRLKHLIGTPMALGLVILATGCAGSRYDRSTGESIDDRATTTRVKGALGDDTAYKYPDVKVTTFKGKVQLSGFVDNREQKNRAEDIAKNAVGVKDVDNNITVKP